MRAVKPISVLNGRFWCRAASCLAHRLQCNRIAFCELCACAFENGLTSQLRIYLFLKSTRSGVEGEGKTSSLERGGSLCSLATSFQEYTKAVLLFTGLQWEVGFFCQVKLSPESPAWSGTRGASSLCRPVTERWMSGDAALWWFGRWVLYTGLLGMAT